jgi:integrase
MGPHRPEQETGARRARPSHVPASRPTGRPLEPRNVKRSFDARCRKAGVRQIKIHDTRRTCGSVLAALDVHPRVAMTILRHSRIGLTMDIYTQVPDKTTRDALNRLSNLFDLS